MSRRICLLVVAVSFALAAPAATLAQSSSQAQYQGVAPETSTPVTGGGGTPGSGTTSGGAATGTGGSTQSQTGGATSGASGNGGGGANAPAATGQFTPPAVTPSGSSQTAPFSGGDWVWIVIALAALTGLGFLLRYAMRTPTST